MKNENPLHWRWIAAGVITSVLAFYAIQALEKASAVVANGDFGYRPNPDGTKKFLTELPQPFFKDAGAETVAKAEGKDTFLYRSAYKAHQAVYNKPWVVGRQGIGDCVSWGWAHGVWIALCVDWETGRLANPPPMIATEAIYGGSRVEARNLPGGGNSPVGGWSDGSYGGAAAKFVRDWGVVFREKHPGYDLSFYSAERAKQWGAYGCGGQNDGGYLDKIAKEHPATHVALVKTFDEAAAAIESGFPVPVASDVGFSSSRDSNGYASASGNWAHEMCFIAVRYKANGSPDDALLCLNSWGPSWIAGGKFPSDQPDGSFWVRRATVERMLQQQDSFCVGSVTGFGWRDLHHGDWLQPAPQAFRSIQPAKLIAGTFSVAP